MIKAAGVIFRTADGKVLLIKRTAEGDHAGEWAFPGGKIEEGESPQEAACRECFEELGDSVPLTPDALKLHTRRIANGVDYTTFIVDVDAPFDVTLNDEHDDSMWADPKQPEQRADAEFVEGDHERDESGKFSSSEIATAKSRLEKIQKESQPEETESEEQKTKVWHPTKFGFNGGEWQGSLKWFPIRHPDWFTKRKVPISKIKYSQPWVVPAGVEKYLEEGVSKNDLPQVAYDKTNDIYYCAHGHHRTSAHLLAGRSDMLADVFEYETSPDKKSKHIKPKKVKKAPQ